MNAEERTAAIELLTATDQGFLKKLSINTESWINAGKECAARGWVSIVGHWHVLTPAGLRAITSPQTKADQRACLHLLAGVPDRRCLERLERLGMVACEAGFPVLTLRGVSTVDALRALEETKRNNRGRSIIEDGERYHARTWL